MKLLIVDDSMIVRNAIERGAGQTDITEIYQAENGLDALELYRMHQPDLMTLDLTMPKMDGMGCLAEIAKMGGHTAILVISALNSHRTVMSAASLGASGFVVKPFTARELEDALDQLIRHARSNFGILA